MGAAERASELRILESFLTVSKSQNSEIGKVCFSEALIGPVHSKNLQKTYVVIKNTS